MAEDIIVDEKAHGDNAAFLSPLPRVVCVEHPGIIRNIDNGITSMGGPIKVHKFLENHQPSIAVSLRPNDVLAKPIRSLKIDTYNVLLRVTVPRRTGLKRKRGSKEPWVEDDDVNQNTPESLMRTLHDNPNDYTIEPAGLIEDTHRFRDLPDLQYVTSTNPLMTTVREGVMPGTLAAIKSFKLNRKARPRHAAHIGPPPTFSQIDVPLQYTYLQNPYADFVEDKDGNVSSRIRNPPKQYIMHVLPPDAPSVPAKSPVPLPPEAGLEPLVRQVVHDLRSLLEKRPIMTKRAIGNLMGRENEDYWKHAFAHVGYMFRGGPWKDAIIRFGVDPRTDPKYRIYQTAMFQLRFKSATKAEQRAQSQKWTASALTLEKTGFDGHIFDGTKVVPDGKLYQVCDVVDPQLKSLIDNPDGLRSECDPIISGWFGNAQWAKFKVIMRAKLITILDGKQPRDSDYERIVAMPDVLTSENAEQAAPPKATSDERAMLDRVRNLAADADKDVYLARRARMRMEAGAGHERDSVDVEEPGFLEEEEAVDEADNFLESADENEVEEEGAFEEGANDEDDEDDDPEMQLQFKQRTNKPQVEAQPEYSDADTDDAIDEDEEDLAEEDFDSEDELAMLGDELLRWEQDQEVDLGEPVQRDE